MNLFIPDLAYINPRVKNYKVGRDAIKYLEKLEVPLIESRQVKIEGNSPKENYIKAKKTIYVTINSQKKLSSCRPSADYQFSLSSSCPGHCTYCYLQTTQGEKPVMKLFVNIEDILKVIEGHINDHQPNITSFESGSITDPLALDHITGNLKRCILYFANNEKGRLRVITKYDNVDQYLDIQHNGHTKFRFSINAKTVIRKYEHHTASLDERINAAKKIAKADYPLGFIIAPIMIYEQWEKEYKDLIETLKYTLEGYHQTITFELIQHRFTATAKSLILSRFPNTDLDLNEENRILKWGPYGKFKYIYPKEQSTKIKEYISKLIYDNFENAQIEYFT